MSDRRTLIVAGLGRCGTSMVMRMLGAADVPTVGNLPDWECPETQHLLESDPARWAEAVRGKAVKVLDAHRWHIPHIGGCDILWLARDPREQAKSMVKLFSSAFTMISPDRRTIRTLAKSIGQDTPLAIRSIQRADPNHRGIAMRFEAILERPLTTAHIICKAFDLNPDKAPIMAAQVMRRKPECLPYLMEAAFV